MSLPSPLRALCLALALTGGLLLSACSGLTPAYDQAAAPSALVEVRYAQPQTRAEQIVYQELTLRLGGATTRTDSPIVTVRVTEATRDLTQSQSDRPVANKEVTLTAQITVIRETGAMPETLFSGERRATATYTASGQVLADQQAATNASERAARLLAESVRLSLITALSPL